MTADEGAGPVGTLVGVAVFAVLLLVAANVLLHLHTASVVTAVAFDAARTVAGAGPAEGVPVTRAAATAAARDLLGTVGGDARFDWSASDAGAVRLRLAVPGPHLLPAPLLRAMGLADVSRAVAVRVERFAP